jgi:toxin ParE1/3/4
MTGCIFSPAAQADLEEIWDYTERVWGAARAERYILSIRDACDALAHGRLQGRPADGIRPGYHRLAVGSHLLFYKRTDQARFEIIRVLHRRMDIATRLGEG